MSEMGNPQENDSRLGWLAGMIDGEGSLVLGEKKKQGQDWVVYQPYLGICNTDPAIILKLIDIYDSMKIRYYIHHRHKPSHLGNKEIYHVHVTRMEHVKRILMLVMDMMVGKKAKAILMCKWIDSRLAKKNSGDNQSKRYTSEEHELAERIMTLNDFTRDPEREMIKSDLHRKLAELAEMTNRLSYSERRT